MSTFVNVDATPVASDTACCTLTLTLLHHFLACCHFFLGVPVIVAMFLSRGPSQWVHVGCFRMIHVFAHVCRTRVEVLIDVIGLIAGCHLRHSSETIENKCSQKDQWLERLKASQLICRRLNLSAGETVPPARPTLKRTFADDITFVPFTEVHEIM